MKRLNVRSFVLLALLVTFIYSCEKNDEEVPQNLEVQDFIWKGMNAFYYWQAEIPNLADTRFSSQRELNGFLSSYNGAPNSLFEDLRFQPGVVDRFSRLVTDYVALENSLQGTNLSTGMEFGLVRFDNDPSLVYGYVRYVVASSDAAVKGIARGMLFTHVNGTQLTDTNFGSLLFSSDTSISIELADFNGGNPTPNGTVIDLIKSQVTDEPILIHKVIDEGANRIGYLMYNQFASAFDVELNNVFASFQSENITDLIIDLRYNGGGFTSSAIHLAGMITGQFTDQLFYTQEWNQKVKDAFSDRPGFFNANFRGDLRFLDANNEEVSVGSLNSLNLNRVYFITTGSTASASELIIAGLEPYITVNTVGTTTVGKNVGSITLYDSDNYTRGGDNLNPNHSFAMVPTTFEYKNSDGINYFDGIPPDVLLREDFGNLGVLGERSDPLLDRTIQFIVTGSRGVSGKTTLDFQEEISNSKLFTPASNRLFDKIDIKSVLNPILE